MARANDNVGPALRLGSMVLGNPSVENFNGDLIPVQMVNADPICKNITSFVGASSLFFEAYDRYIGAGLELNRNFLNSASILHTEAFDEVRSVASVFGQMAVFPSRLRLVEVHFQNQRSAEQALEDPISGWTAQQTYEYLSDCLGDEMARLCQQNNVNGRILLQCVRTRAAGSSSAITRKFMNPRDQDGMGFSEYQYEVMVEFLKEKGSVGGDFKPVPKPALHNALDGQAMINAIEGLLAVVRTGGEKLGEICKALFQATEQNAEVAGFVNGIYDDINELNQERTGKLESINEDERIIEEKRQMLPNLRSLLAAAQSQVASFTALSQMAGRDDEQLRETLRNQIESARVRSEAPPVRIEHRRGWWIFEQVDVEYNYVEKNAAREQLERLTQNLRDLSSRKAEKLAEWARLCSSERANEAANIQEITNVESLIANHEARINTKRSEIKAIDQSIEAKNQELCSRIEGMTNLSQERIASLLRAVKAEQEFSAAARSFTAVQAGRTSFLFVLLALR